MGQRIIADLCRRRSCSFQNSCCARVQGHRDNLLPPDRVLQGRRAGVRRDSAGQPLCSWQAAHAPAFPACNVTVLHVTTRLSHHITQHSSPQKLAPALPSVLGCATAHSKRQTSPTLVDSGPRPGAVLWRGWAMHWCARGHPDQPEARCVLQSRQPLRRQRRAHPPRPLGV